MKSGKDEADFLSRWSRRKRAAPEPEAEPRPRPPAEAPLAEGANPAPEKTDAEILAELGLPDPDTLGKGDDFTAFLKGAVPARLRNRALRRLWLTNPVLANLDQLVDYGEDFTDAATVVENLQTAYQVGRGLLQPDPPAAETAETEAAAEEAALAEAPPGEVAAPSGEEESTAEADEPDEQAVAEAADEEAQDEPPPARPRRMRFHFEEG